jgi:polysaccharide chain length determinant protein (PEP-CTERM system associated)
MAPKKPSAARPDMHPLSIIRMLWKRKRSVLLIWLVLSAVAVAIVYKLPTLYTSEALILVESQKIPEKYVAATVNSEVQDRLATISQEILSSTRLQKIIEDFNLYQDEKKNHVQEEILEMMRKDITIKLEKGWTGNRPGAFRIGYVGPNPALIAQVANRIANLFIEENLRSREVQAEGTAEFIDTQLQDAKKKLDELEAAVGKYKVQHNGELPQQETALQAAVTRLQTELQANRDAIGRAYQSKLMAENTLQVSEDMAATLARSPGTANTVQGRPDAPGTAAAPGKLKNSEVLQSQLDSLLGHYREEHPDVVRLRDQIARAKKAEEEKEAQEASKTTAVQKAESKAPSDKPAPVKTGNAVTPVETAQWRERINGLKLQISILDKEIDQRHIEESRILGDIKALQSRIERLPLREQEMAGVTRDYEITKANYKALLDKKISATMATDMERRQKSERFTLLDPARVPELPYKPNRPLFYGLGSALGLVIGLAFAVGGELRKDLLLGEWELPRDLVVLGRVPDIRLAIPAAASGVGQPSQRPLRWRFALVSSAVFSVLVVLAAAAGYYFKWIRF